VHDRILLQANASPRAFAENYKPMVEIIIVEPTFREEGFWLGKDPWVIVHSPDGDGNGRLCLS
jgi:hypothetical protein